MWIYIIVLVTDSDLGNPFFELNMLNNYGQQYFEHYMTITKGSLHKYYFKQPKKGVTTS